MQRVSRILLILTALTIPAGAAPVHLTFTHQADGKPLHFDSLRYRNATGESFSSTRLSYLVSEVSLKSGSDDVTIDTVAFIDALRGRNGVTLKNVPPARYDALTFHIGLAPDLNHADPARFTANHPLNPTLNNLHWDWQGGYIFMALEGHWRRPGEVNPGGYAYHFANDANRTRITLPGPIEIRNETDLVISVDLARILDGLSFEADGATTHSQENDPVAKRLRSNLPSAFLLRSVSPSRAVPRQKPAAPIDLPPKLTPFPITLPKHVPIPALPGDNPLITERVTLGERLFHDPLLSRDGTISCSSCHDAGIAFTDSRRFSPGVDGDHGDRHSMPLFNLAWKERFFWDGRAPSLRAQTLIPIEDHLEMDESLENVVVKLKSDESYSEQFAKAFRSAKITPLNLSLALENFLLTRLSFDSKFDRMLKGQADFSAEEQRGLELFFTESEPRLGRRGADCFHCHGGTLFSDHSFHNTGLAGEDPGLFKVTGKESDRKKFSTPSLRNVAATAPYMHDGRFASLEEVVEHYNSGFERSPTLDPNLAKHPQGLGLHEDEKKALIAFLKTLTDEAYTGSKATD